MCDGSVCTHPSYNYKNPPSVFFFYPYFKSPFSNQPVLRFLSEWSSSVQAAPTIDDWQDRLNLDPPWVRWELSTIVSTPVQGKTRLSLRLSDWGVFGCNNEYSSRYSRHLSCWRRRVLTLLSLRSECANPRSAYIRLCSRESFVIQLHLQKKWV